MLTARDMITQAMRELGVSGSGESATAEELEDGRVRLNSMLRSWMAKGLNLWRDSAGSVTLVPNVSTVTLPDAVSVGDVRIRENGSDRPLAEWEADDYAAIPSKGTTGVPLAYTLKRSVSGLTLVLWPVPDRAVTLAYDYARSTMPVEQLAEAVDVPEQFEEAVWVNLAARLAPMYGKVRSDPATVQAVLARAAELERDMLDFDRPASYWLGAA
jgi:hypothetical protein